ncbi:MAG: hypothetical protein ACI9R3_006529 [Verrucomicrobiales bacterium]|jgi:hypothetical protein
MSLTPDPIDEASEPLMESIKASIKDLSELLDRVDSHGRGEDKFYRFYHQSFKLYSLQSETLAIVEALRRLWPQRELHPWFRQIIEAGTGHEFVAEDNRDWLAKGRPILEAFFHARTMLEFAVRYGKELEHAPRLMPSGWAALLELYSSRYALCDPSDGSSGGATNAPSGLGLLGRFEL